uniref:IMD domain-containing protein n=1 Tax=Athene cunicularia TaxID=194338 RepID=A0A663M797_ATHCN
LALSEGRRRHGSERQLTIMEQFNPSLRNFISMGKTYEKALASMTYAAKGYFDALVKMGELASESQGSKELGDVLFQMAEVHRQIQNQLEEMVSALSPARGALRLAPGSAGVAAEQKGFPGLVWVMPAPLKPIC